MSLKLKIAVISSVMCLSACATVQTPDARDPFEGFNRSVYSFNQGVDKVVMKPVALAYTQIVPNPVRSCVSNMFSNVGDLWSALNSFLQGRGHEAINSVGRVLFNSSIGVFGCFDVATQNGASKVSNDFGQTLGVWGVRPGPYLVLPVIGPSSFRDTGGLVVDSAASPIGNIDHVPTRNSLMALGIVSTRANLLDATSMLTEVSLDEYSFVRDAFFQRRDSLIHRAQAGFEGSTESDSLPDYSDDEPTAATLDEVPAQDVSSEPVQDQ